MTDENADYQKAQSGQPLALEKRDQSEDGRRYSPSIGRNKDVVRAAVLDLLPSQGRILEIASGTGEHGAHITPIAEALNWTYSDIDPDSQASQIAWRNSVDHGRLSGPLTIDTTRANWGDAEAQAPWDGMFCANMIHIAPIEAGQGLIAGAGRLLRPGGRLMLYGPFARNGEIASSNAQFSEDLKRRDPRWGVRDLELQILPRARQANLALVEVRAMPANNLSVVFEKA
ncbi:MAG: DUF938 domain-containing protein [Pseudomonadota bacterium]